MNKTVENLQTLIQIPAHQFNAVIKLINPDVTDKDLEPMFPEGWALDSNWPVESRRTAAQEYEAFKSIQLRIDNHNEFMAGCFD